MADPALLSPVEVRKRLVETLELDLVGPWPGHELETERLERRMRPSNWYLTGFLVPVGAPPEQLADADSDDEIDEVPESEGTEEESADDRVAAKKAYFPSSIGLSALMPANAKELHVTVTWGDYVTGDVEPETGADEGEEPGKPIPVWERHPREAAVTIALGEHPGALVSVPLPDSAGLEIQALEREIPDGAGGGGLPAGTRSVSVFLVNKRAPDDQQPDTAYAFQPQLKVRGDTPFVPRPDLRSAGDWDDQVADLHYADTPEFATGHGIAPDWTVVDEVCREVRTRWIPHAEVQQTKTVKIDGVELSMRKLGDLADGSAARLVLSPLVIGYREWIEAQSGGVQRLSGEHRDVAEELLRLAGLAADRIERGVEVLASDADALDAFRLANRAVAAALGQPPARIADPEWRAFQLAFILLNVPGIADPADPNRETVDLLFFPTGGGKTEAYLGLAAFTMVLRRLRNPAEDARAAGGVSVIMRYTLRLLTLDQLGRAARLICALELERAQAPDRYGTWPFEIGLWVGKAATPNLMGRKGDKRSDTARTKVRQYKNDPQGKPSPIPLEDCPWCGTRFTEDSFSLLPDAVNPRELRVVCISLECPFNGDRTLPIVAVDEPLYRRLPAFLVATVDKFAALPWTGESGALLGGATRFDGDGYYGAAVPGKGKQLTASLSGPDLVIQDELHLISGPLGTMAGLYETVIETLSARRLDGTVVRPKIVASTATVRRAQDQVQALFGRPVTQIFPPPGPDRRDSFFARTVAPPDAPARLYVGVAAQGRNPKIVMRKVWLALMGAAELLYRKQGGHEQANNPVDPYMTVLGYFNSLRELGGARRILEEEVRNTLLDYGSRRRVGEQHHLFRDRKTFSEVVELTSRVPTDKVAEARRRLGLGFDSKERIDCAIATNMISVGLDISRLGLMGVLGQPKTSSEYIQATSRVGRSDSSPGLVVTLLNIHKPRDRSHYERFRHYHETFYRSVEVSSVTPFSARAMDRGFAGALVALARHAHTTLTPSLGAEKVSDNRAALEEFVLGVFRDRLAQQPISPEERAERIASVQGRVGDLLDSWTTIRDGLAKDGIDLKYQKYEAPDKAKPLLHEVLDDVDDPHEAKFRVARSLRGVEPEVNLFLKELSGKWAEDAS